MYPMLLHYLLPIGVVSMGQFKGPVWIVLVPRMHVPRKKSRMHGVLNEVCETSLGMSVTFRDESNDNN